MPTIWYQVAAHQRQQHVEKRIDRQVPRAQRNSIGARRRLVSGLRRRAGNDRVVYGGQLHPTTLCGCLGYAYRDSHMASL